MDKNDLRSEIHKLSDHKRLIFGSERSIRELRVGNIEKVFISTMTNPKTISLLSSHGARIIGTGLSSSDLGIACKKPFSVSVVGVRSEKTD